MDGQDEDEAEGEDEEMQDIPTSMTLGHDMLDKDLTG